jgi:hypothetical protein
MASSIPSLRCISKLPGCLTIIEAGISKSCIMARNDSGYTSNEIADYIENS